MRTRTVQAVFLALTSLATACENSAASPLSTAQAASPAQPQIRTDDHLVCATKECRGLAAWLAEVCATAHANASKGTITIASTAHEETVALDHGFLRESCDTADDAWTRGILDAVLTGEGLWRIYTDPGEGPVTVLGLAGGPISIDAPVTGSPEIGVIVADTSGSTSDGGWTPAGSQVLSAIVRARAPRLSAGSRFSVVTPGRASWDGRAAVPPETHGLLVLEGPFASRIARILAVDRSIADHTSGSDHVPALKRATEGGAATVYFVSDGEIGARLPSEKQLSRQLRRAELEAWRHVYLCMPPRAAVLYSTGLRRLDRGPVTVSCSQMGLDLAAMMHSVGPGTAGPWAELAQRAKHD